MIRCTQQQNTECLKCGKVPFDIVRIGAFCMCTDCFIKEFGADTTEIMPESKLGKIYYKWLKKYKKTNIA